MKARKVNDYPSQDDSFFFRTMKISISFLLLIFLAGLNSCSDQQKKVVEESYPDGSPKVVKFYKENEGNKELVKEIDYYPNKNKRLEGEYKQEQRNGKWTYYYENGNIWSEGFFKDGVNEGLRTTYFENGQIRYTGQYKNGERTGIWRFNNEEGKLVKEMDYGDGGKAEHDSTAD